MSVLKRLTANKLLALLICFMVCTGGLAQATKTAPLKVATWNIWHGGRENGDSLGPLQVADLLQLSGADVIALQETYGSGKYLSDRLGYHFHPRGTNVSILSRYPVIADISVFQPFHCAGALIELPTGKKIAFYSIWLSYDTDIWLPNSRDTLSNIDMLAATRSSAWQADSLLAAVSNRLKKLSYPQVPVIIAGDFNTMSHLDYTMAAQPQYKFVINWPVSSLFLQKGYFDAYRQKNPVVNRLKDRTWSPRFANQEQDRIDFIYYKGNSLVLKNAGITDSCRGLFPSDHALVWAQFELF
ncbi:MAG: endonuclease/exonuclease/phosphatase family protein [Chitinophagaceae bacterium]|nr:endonuclease/exonuclease/phosphatase family protein [Chitinophagaceae bacterium]